MLIAEESIEKHIWDEQTHMVTLGCQFLSTKDAWTSLKEKRKAKEGKGKRKEERKENQFLLCLVDYREKKRHVPFISIYFN